MDNRCTFFPNGNWLECCIWHDYMCIDARLQQSAAMRKTADIDLWRCVTQKGHPLIAWVMYFGVRSWAVIKGGY